MCEIIIKCNKCKKVLSSIKYKIKRLEKSIKKAAKEETKIFLQGQIDSLLFCKKKLLEFECIKESEEIK